MSVDRIVMMSDETSRASEIAAIVHRVLGEPLGRVRSSVVRGAPFAAVPIYQNDHDERAEQLRQLITAFAAAQLVVRYFELMPGDSPDDPDVRALAELTGEEVMNVLDRHEEAHERRKQSFGGGH